MQQTDSIAPPPDVDAFRLELAPETSPLGESSGILTLVWKAPTSEGRSAIRRPPDLLSGERDRTREAVRLSPGHGTPVTAAGTSWPSPVPYNTT